MSVMLGCFLNIFMHVINLRLTTIFLESYWAENIDSWPFFVMTSLRSVRTVKIVNMIILSGIYFMKTLEDNMVFV